MATQQKKSATRNGFKTGEFVVYPSHGVGQITAIEEQEVAGFKLELFVVSFAKDKMTLRVPVPKIATVGMRKLSETTTACPRFSIFSRNRSSRSFRSASSRRFSFLSKSASPE